MRRSARLIDVAETAGVSKATASNVFNRPDLVRPELRARVLAAAQAIGYAGPDPKGRLLSAGKVNALGVATAEPLASFFEDPYARVLMAGIAEVCDAEGVGISLVSAATQDALAWNIRSAVVDGLILFCLEESARLIAASRARGLPFVALDFGGTDPTVPAIAVDDRLGARLAAGHVAGLGHRRFAILAMEIADGRGGRVTAERARAADYSCARDRIEGVLEALAALGHDPEAVPIFETLSDAETIHPALEALFAAPEPPTAILAQSDRIAMIALAWLQARGRRVPEEVSVVGFDDVPEAARSVPPLTTIRQPIAEIGRRAVRAILDRPGEPLRDTLSVELILRASTAPPPAAG